MKIDEATLAELRFEFRRLYGRIGYSGMMQVLYELLKSSEILCEVMREENDKERKKRVEP